MKVRLTPAALEDIGAIHQSLAGYSEGLATRVEDAVFDALDVFARFPQFGVPTDESSVHRWPLGEFRYTIFYRISWHKEVIEVLRIVGSNRVRDLKRVPR